MSSDDFSRYHGLRRNGSSPAEVYRHAVADGMDEIACFRLLREVFGLSLVDAKRVVVTASGRAESLEEHQEGLLPGAKNAVRDSED